MKMPRPGIRRLGTLVAAGLLAAFGCAGGTCRACARDSKAPDETEGAASAEEDDELAPEDSDVEVLAVGSLPRVALRVGRWEGLRYRTEIETAGTFGAVGHPAVVGPRMKMEFIYEVLRGSANPLERAVEGGVRHFVEERAILDRASVQSAELPPQVVADWNRLLQGFHGSTLRQLIGESGGIEELTLELIAGQQPPPEVKQATDAALDMQRRFPFRLPPVRVGVGARWRFSGEVIVSGVAAVQTAEMTLKELDDAQARIRFVLRLQAPRQVVPHPFEPGKTASLDVFRGDGDGEITVDRLTGIPLRGRLSMTSRLTLKGEVAGAPAEATLLASNTVLQRAAILKGDGGLREESSDRGVP